MSNSFMQAQLDFDKNVKKGKMESLINSLRWKDSSLLSLYEVTSIIKPRSESYEGMQTIEVDKIIGSEGRYKDFSFSFLPKKNFLKGRWQSIDRAHLEQVVLPPISVYYIGGFYFVRDGNHRVSVAKSLGVEFIDAEVVRLDSVIKLEKGITIKQIKKLAVNHERNMFMEQYSPSYLPMGTIVFTTPGAYPEMVNHILVHKWYLNENQEEEISFETAAVSWYKNVYLPIISIIREEHFLSNYPKSTEGDIYMVLVRKWDDLKKKKN